MGMPVSVVQTLGPNCYNTFLESVGGGKDAITHKALVTFHDTESPQDTYVKVYCRQMAPKGLVNEIAGYVIAKGDGLPVPERAAVILLSPEQAAYLPSSITPHVTNEGLVVAWCVQSIGGETPSQAFDLDVALAAGIPLLQADFAKWPHLPQAVSLDAWLLNEDRNTGNLIRLGVGRYALIDHGRICTGNGWAAPLDRNKMKHTNMLAWVAWNEPDIEKAPTKHRSTILAACDRHTATLADTVTELEHWLAALLATADKDDVEGFFGDRTTTVGSHLRNAYGVLI